MSQIRWNRFKEIQ